MLKHVQIIRNYKISFNLVENYELQVNPILGCLKYKILDLIFLNRLAILFHIFILIIKECLIESKEIVKINFF